MDPLTALGLASNILSFVDFASKLVKIGHEIGHSVSGSTVGNAEVEAVTRTLSALSRRLKPPRRRGDYGVSSHDDRMSDTEEGIESIAASSEEIAEQLLVALNGLKITSEKRTFESFYYALKTVMHESEIKALKARLMEHQAALQTALLISLREQANIITPAMIENLRSGPKIDQMKADILQAVDKLHDVREDRQKDDIAKQLIVLTKQQTEEEMQRRILEQLRFDDQDDRLFRVPEAHSATFRWIFDKGLTGGEHQWDDFPSWLAKDDPLYWITGKAGSGKSTLMKFLMSRPECSTALRRWAGDVPLIVVNFFFWNPGSRHQQSQEGLFRSILHQVLSRRPDLIPATLPKRWARTELFGYDTSCESIQELTTGFNSVLNSTDGSFKLFMFIDGLDEFNGDLNELVQLFKRAVSKDNIKACLSSRPWVVFEEAFRTTPSLKLEDLTYVDIVTYISAKFNDNSGFQALQQHEAAFASGLIQNIATKACGVFLWVYLVTRSLLNGLSNFDTISDLQRRLDDFPADLENFYHRIFSGIEEFYRARAYEYFRMVAVAQGDLTALGLSYIDGDHTLLCSLAAGDVVPPLESAERKYRIQATGRRLNSHCKGLLEITKVYSDRHDPQVTYLHRTTKDFLESHDIRSRILDQAKTYDPRPLLLYSEILMIRYTDLPIINLQDSEIQRLLSYAEVRERDGTLDPVVLERLNERLDGVAARDSTCSCAASGNHKHGFVETAARKKLHSYIVWKLDRGCAIFTKPSSASLLSQVAFKYSSFEAFHQPGMELLCPFPLLSVQVVKAICGARGLFDNSFELEKLWTRLCNATAANIERARSIHADAVRAGGDSHVGGASKELELLVTGHWADIFEILFQTAVSGPRTIRRYPEASWVRDVFEPLSTDRVEKLLDMHSQLEERGRRTIQSATEDKLMTTNQDSSHKMAARTSRLGSKLRKLRSKFAG